MPDYLSSVKCGIAALSIYLFVCLFIYLWTQSRDIVELVLSYFMWGLRTKLITIGFMISIFIC